jgi:hypothetical protein
MLPAVLPGLVNNWAIAAPQLEGQAEVPPILPVLRPNVHANVLGAVAVRLIPVVAPLQIAAGAVVVIVGV